MGRYSMPLAPRLVDFAAVAPDQRALDVGCGPGALTGELVARLGAHLVTAVDPSEPFVAAARGRYPAVQVHHAAAEQLPFDDDTFDATLAQLVVHFMADPVAGLAEMARVTRPGGVIAACVWDHEGGTGPLSLFWEAVHQLAPDIEGEVGMAGARRGHLGELMRSAGIGDVHEDVLAVDVEHAGFDEWWEPYTLGVGPAGAYVDSLGDEHRTELRERCRGLVPDGPFVITARAWVARGRA